MKKLELYTGEKTYMFPNGTVAEPNTVKAKYPAVDVFQHVVETDENGEVLFGLSNLSALRSRYNIDATLTVQEALSAIETIINTVPEVSPSAEERIAAALEYQNLISMEDVTK